MGRHKETYTATWNARRRPTVDSQGRVRIPLEIQRGDAGRPLELCMTEEELDSVSKAVLDARLLHAAAQVRAEQQQRALKLQLRVSDLERQKTELERRNVELKGQIERVHDVVHPDRSDFVVQQDGTNVGPRPDVAH